MCVYISITLSGTEIESRYNRKLIPEEKDIFTGFYFASAFEKPSVPVITGSSNKINFYEWGLIPFWAKDAESAEVIRKKTFNARSETVFEKPSFKNSIMKRRCLIVADGFFEWKDVGGKKYPYYIKLKDQKIFSIAGIYDIWHDKRTFSVITTEANGLMAEIHNVKKRMPVILKREDEEKWLSETPVEEIKSLMVGYDEKFMEAYTVSKLITAKGTKKNDPDVIARYEYDELKS
jgi:putative SOS response-associated peptidase YedK